MMNGLNKQIGLNVTIILISFTFSKFVIVHQFISLNKKSELKADRKSAHVIPMN